MRGSTAGLHETIVLPSRNAHAILLEVIDIFISSFIVSPLVVGYWRGTWNLMNHILYPDDLLYSSLMSCLIGALGHLIFVYFKDQLKNIFDPNKRRLTYFFGSRLYTVTFGIVCVNGWRGVWSLLDLYTAPTPETLPITRLIHESATVIVCVLMLALIKGLRNITSAPFFICKDHSKDYFEVPTMFKTSVRIF